MLIKLILFFLVVFSIAAHGIMLFCIISISFKNIEKNSLEKFKRRFNSRIHDTAIKNLKNDLRELNKTLLISLFFVPIIYCVLYWEQIYRFLMNPIF